jgi:hypothetical protein
MQAKMNAEDVAMTAAINFALVRAKSGILLVDRVKSTADVALCPYIPSTSKETILIRFRGVFCNEFRLQPGGFQPGCPCISDFIGLFRKRRGRLVIYQEVGQRGVHVFAIRGWAIHAVVNGVELVTVLFDHIFRNGPA